MSDLDTEPFCHKGCKDVYVHIKQCTHSEYPAIEPESYPALKDEQLLDEYDNLHADYHRYSHPPIDWNSGLREYHKPTYMEAGRRMSLIRQEILRRMS